VTPEPPPSDSECNIKAFNLIRRCPYLPFDVVVDVCNVTDIEQLVWELEAIEEFTSGKK
jgi:hypothetical protein